MTRRVTTWTVIERDLGSATELSKRLDKLGLLAPVAKIASRGGEIYYDKSLGPIVERATTLAAAGYAPKDIALVLGRVESGRREPIVEVVNAAELALRTRVSVERLVGSGGWVERGLVGVWALDDAGTPLFLLESVMRVRALAALEALGLGELVGDWIAGTVDTARVRARIVEVEAAAKVLARVLPKVTRKRKPRVRGQTRSMSARKA